MKHSEDSVETACSSLKASTVKETIKLKLKFHQLNQAAFFINHTYLYSADVSALVDVEQNRGRHREVVLVLTRFGPPGRRRWRAFDASRSLYHIRGRLDRKFVEPGRDVPVEVGSHG